MTLAQVGTSFRSFSVFFFLLKKTIDVDDSRSQVAFTCLLAHRLACNRGVVDISKSSVPIQETIAGRFHLSHFDSKQ